MAGFPIRFVVGIWLATKPRVHMAVAHRDTRLPHDELVATHGDTAVDGGEQPEYVPWAVVVLGRVLEARVADVGVPTYASDPLRSTQLAHAAAVSVASRGTETRQRTPSGARGAKVTHDGIIPEEASIDRVVVIVKGPELQTRTAVLKEAVVEEHLRGRDVLHRVDLGSRIWG